MDLDQDVFTTFEAAEICNANITSIKNWIDQGELSAFKTPGGHYRIEREELDAFLDRHGMPNPFAERREKRLLVVHPEPAIAEEISGELDEDHDWDATDDGVDALLKIGQWKPDAAVVDSRVEKLDVPGLCRRIDEHADLAVVDVIALYGDEDQGRALRDAGAAYTVERGEGTAQIVETLRRVLE